jgi:glutamate transport system permease protein
MVTLLSRYDVLAAFWVTVRLTFYAALGALGWGTVLAAMRVSPVPLMRGFAAGFVTVVRNTPLTVVIMFCSFGLYQTMGLALADQRSNTFIEQNNFRLAVLGLAAYTSTFVAESIRSGINTVPVGQAEAARAIGLSFVQTLRMIVMPQAFRSVIAPLASVLIALTKNSTVASVIGVAEASGLMKEMIENESDVILLVFAIFALGFVLLTLPTGLVLGWVARRTAVLR